MTAPSRHVARARSLLLAVPVSMALTGCASWPDPGTGGLAELERTRSPRILAVEEDFHNAIRKGAGGRNPALLTEVRLLLIRARREHAGGLLADAEYSLDKAEELLSALRRHG